MAHRRVKRCSTPPTIRQMQIKATRSWHLPPVRMAVINKSADKGWRGRGDPHALGVGLPTGAATGESSVEIPQKIKNGIAS